MHKLLPVSFAGLILLGAAARGQENRGDGAPLRDPTRPVTQITRTSFTLQYFTRAPCPTRVQVREGDLPMTAWRPEGKKSDLWTTPAVRVVNGPSGTRAFHMVTVGGLRPGRRYFYRVYDPAAKPTAQEASWGARAGWRREWAVSTQAERGGKTILRLPVKVLLMPNVLNVTSGPGAPPPAKMTDAEINRIRAEYAVASRFFFVNSGMRYWVDFRIHVDARWQRWGEEPANADAFYRGWPVSRSWAGEDFRGPGGGAFTIVDTRDPERTNAAPVYEARPFAAQIEQAFPRRWNAATRRWEFYSSGGGTLGVDGFPQGVPGRSQFLGGGDTAWLAAHEFHHQMESQGAFSFANREDDRIVFDHPAVRSRDNPWNTAGRHGEHWDVLAFWDRTLTDAQWLRLYFGETITVADRDEDGFPDADARLPLDEKRFGSSSAKARTDGRLNDLSKVMLSTWAPAPLQNTFTKPPFQAIKPNPTNPDTDGDGLTDDTDPYPLIPYPPFVWPLSANVDGNGAEWKDVPASGASRRGGITTSFKQGHDEANYYGYFLLSGPWRRVRLTLDGEGRGIFSGEGIETLEIVNDENLTIRKPDYAASTATRTGDSVVWEFRLPNRGAGKWFWERGGREVGAAIEVTDTKGTITSVYEPYRLFYARMLESSGRDPLPPNAPAELTRQDATRVLLPGAPALKFTGTGWRLENGALRHTGEDESAAYLDGLAAREFDLWMEFEAKQDAILGAFVPGTTELSAGNDYIAFIGGYANTVTRLRLFGRETGESEVMITPGRHRMQISRRDGAIWCLFDGKPILQAPDPDPAKIVDRLAVLGGYNGRQSIYEIRVRVVR